MEPECLIRCSQESATRPCPEPVESSPQPWTLFLLRSILSNPYSNAVILPRICVFFLSSCRHSKLGPLLSIIHGLVIWKTTLAEPSIAEAEPDTRSTVRVQNTHCTAQQHPLVSACRWCSTEPPSVRPGYGATISTCRSKQSPYTFVH
jgi:hypothetical protein